MGSVLDSIYFSSFETTGRENSPQSDNGYANDNPNEGREHWPAKYDLEARKFGYMIAVHQPLKASK